VEHSHAPAASVVIRLAEWTKLSPETEPALKGLSVPPGAPQTVARSLRDRVDIRPTFDGLEVSSTSFVGRIDVGPLRLVIEPKLEALSLTRLMRYAYGVRDLDVLEPTRADTGKAGIVDLLVSLLCVEGSGLIARGLARRYEAKRETLSSPRGRLLVNELVRRGGIREAALPCHYFERSANWKLNQLVRAGLIHAARLTDDAVLRHRCNRLVQMLADIEPSPGISPIKVEQALCGLDRTTAGYAPALDLIKLLLEASGFTFMDTSTASHLPGFLFDMNIFFQRLLSRFLRENLTTRRLVDELQIRELFRYVPDANPQGLRAPRPRPDYALYEGKALQRFLDAKYRDVWNQRLPSKWLYQLSIYAMASPEPTSVVLYPTMEASAREARLQIRRPKADSGSDAYVVTRPVDMEQLSSLLDPRSNNLEGRRAFAEKLVAA